MSGCHNFGNQAVAAAGGGGGYAAAGGGGGGKSHNPRVVGPLERLTPLQEFFISTLESGNQEKINGVFRETVGAAIGSDNKRSSNLLKFLRVLLHQGNTALPETLSSYLANKRKGWTWERALIWLINHAKKGTVFSVTDCLPGCTVMKPPEVPPHNPSWESLVETFKNFGRGTVAELQVLLRFGYTPSDQGRMNALMTRNRPGTRRR